MAFAFIGSAESQAQACPALGPYYPASNPAPAGEWAERLPRIEALLEDCLNSAEYFALLGAARLNSGQVPTALEALERALLLDPHNGAAQIDYAESLFLAGQLFPALELNDALLKREDLPIDLQPILQARQRYWQKKTLITQFIVEATGGYDTNLNGAPNQRELTLTFGGTPVALTLDSQYQPVEGAFGNLRFGGFWRKQTADYQHELLATARFRETGQDSNALAQADWRYSFIVPQRHYTWELVGGTSHLNFGRKALYTIAEGRARLRWGAAQQCQPAVEGNVQQLSYHGQQVLDGLETGLGASYSCLIGQQKIVVEGSALQNRAKQAERPGGDRQGWNLRIGWQYQSGPHQFSSQISYSRLRDEHGYSPLLANDAVREVTNQSYGFRYQWAFTPGAAVLVNVSHQNQQSNLQPFENRGAVGEVGIALSF